MLVTLLETLACTLGIALVEPGGNTLAELVITADTIAAYYRPVESAPSLIMEAPDSVN